MRTLITGVSSEIGMGIARTLINTGHEVVGYDSQLCEAMPSNIEFIQADVRDLPLLSQHARHCDNGIHLAVRAGDAFTNSVMDVNVSGAYNFMAVAQKHGFSNAIVASSAPVHLQCSIDRELVETASDEDHAYDLSKLLQEVIARDFHTHGTPVLCVRFGHVVRGAQELNLSTPTPLAEYDYCRGGWVALEDVIEACAVALTISPSKTEFEVLNLVGSLGARDKYHVDQAEQRLGFKLAFDFAAYENDVQ